VDRADPFDPESPTSDLSRAGAGAGLAVQPADPLVPGAGPAGWLAAVGFPLRRCGSPLVLPALLAAVPMHFFVGRVDDTVVAAPALSELAGVFGLLLLPLMWLAYFAVSALPLVICLAGTVALAVPTAAGQGVPGRRAVWALVADRLRPLWLWFAVFGLLTQALPLLLTTERLGTAVAGPLTVGLALLSTAVLTLTGMLGCVLLIERGHGPRRAVHLLGRAPTAPLVSAALLLTVLPGLADRLGGSLVSTAAAVAAALLWAVTSLVTYARARSTEGPVTSTSLLRDLSTPAD
jgi:hypothetical protein